MAEIGSKEKEVKKQGLSEWVRENPIKDTMCWEKAASNQLKAFFEMRSPILGSVDCTYEYVEKHFGPFVIGTHTSKSILLPVVEIVSPEGIVFTIRHNFHDYKVSVNSPNFVPNSFGDLFNPTDIPCFFEGFPKDRIYKSYVENPSKFSVAFYHTWEVFTFLWLVCRHPT